jgi:hypothetical protein
MQALRTSALVLALALAGCSSMKVRTEFDPKAAFPAYKTYAWITVPPGEEQATPIRNPTVRGRVVYALDREMGKKGLVQAKEGAEPDFLVFVIGWSQSRVEVSTYGYSYGGAYVYGAYGPGVVVPVSDVREYADGTLILDFIDAKTKKLFWRGTATDTVGSADALQASIDDAARKLMASYPPK